MSNETYDTLVFVGRFQPFHAGHEYVIQKALERCRQVVIVVGSSFASRSLRNPFTFQERKQMIESVFPSNSVKVVPVRDYPYNEQKWVGEVRAIVATQTHSDRIGLVGHSKDHTSYYLNMFPGWGKVDVDNHGNFSATDFRDSYFQGDYDFGGVNLQIQNFLLEFSGTDDYANLKSEYEIIQKYKKSWKCAPYAPTFQTVDAVVIQAGHILLIERKAAPGKGLMALPGGFVNEHERLEDAMLRELREETKIKVPLPVLRGNIKAKETFDDPHRSSRGRTITTAYHIELGDSWALPKIKGGDDAKTAEWVPINEVKDILFFEDHAHIIEHFTGIF